LVIVVAAWREWVESMNSNEEQVRAAIAEQAGEWLVANDEGPLSTRDAEALTAWLRTSPVHIEEFLGVSVIGRDLQAVASDPEFSIAAVVAGARAGDGSEVQLLRPRMMAPARRVSARRWLPVAVAMAAMAALVFGLFSLWNAGLLGPLSAPGDITASFETGHGEQRIVRLADNSVLHLNTDSAVTVRYGKDERLVTLRSGEAEFEVTHDPGRAFRVLAGAAEVVDIGTKFNVRLGNDWTVVTVIEGRVEVGQSATSAGLNAGSSRDRALKFVQLGADQQLRVTRAAWPAVPSGVDAQRATSWLRRQIVFEQEPLERVAAEFNRYCPKSIEIVTPALRDLQISGVFATDDTEAFVAFLRSLKGVRVEVTATRIRVWRNTGIVPPDYT
jgi:transmembrane sensor